MQDKATDYEQKLLTIVDEWENTPPSYLAQAVGVISSPLSLAVTQLIPENTIIKTLEYSFSALKALRGNSDLLVEAEKIGYKVDRVTELLNAPIHICDCLCGYASRWAKSLAGTEGAVTGLMGIAGIAADIPAIILLALRTIDKIAACYGYEVITSSEGEKIFALHCLSISTANTLEDKKDAIAKAIEISSKLDKKSSETLKELNKNANFATIISKETLNATIRNIAKQLCINLVRRKSTQIIPIVGFGIGAALNILFISDVIEASQRLYQKRRLYGSNIIEISKNLIGS